MARRSIISETLTANLREAIINGYFTDILPTETDLASQHGVCRNTLRRALENLETEGHIIKSNGTRRIAPQTLNKKIREICVICRYPNSFRVFLNHLSLVFKQRGHRSHFIFMDNDGSFDASILKGTTNIGLLILGGCSNKDRIEATLTDISAPRVWIDGDLNWFNEDVVNSDGTSASCRAADMLVAKGHHRIGCITRPLFKNRLDNFRNRLEEQGINCNPANFIIYDDHHDEKIYHFLLKKQKITALYVGVLAYFGMSLSEFIHRESIKFPNEISILGYDWMETEFNKTYINPSCFATDFETITELAMDKLERRMDGDKSGHVKYLVEPKFIDMKTIKHL